MTCQKTKHASERAAKLHAKAMRKDLGKACRPLYAYLCEHCGKWHLTRREAWVTAHGIQILKKIQ